MASEELVREIEDQVNEWSTNTTQCLHIALVHSDGAPLADPFHPAFTYPIFGDEEVVFGYQGLRILLTFRPHDLRPRLTITHARKYPALTDTIQPTDIRAALDDFLPEAAFDAPRPGEDEEEDEEADVAGFRPPGERIHRYTRDGDGDGDGDAHTYEVWVASLSDPRARQLLENMQILVPLFIEGGSMLQLEQDWTTHRWKLFLLYRYDPTRLPNGSPYALLGYATSYRVFTLPDRKAPSKDDLRVFSQSLESFLPPPHADAVDMDVDRTASPLELPSRERLSQFLILPPFQGSGHGRELYTTMYTHLTSPANIREFTVEDPNEAFDDLRDLCDLLYLRKNVPAFRALRINTAVPADELTSTRFIPTDLIVDGAQRSAIMQKTKIMPRQFDRLVEMHTLSFIPANHRSRNRITRKEKSSNDHDRAYYFWRLYAKQRLYVFNRDQLAQLEREERIEKLEAALDSVQEGYVAMLDKVEEREKREVEDAEPGASKPRVRKRNVVQEDEEDEEEEEVVVATNGKKARVA
ncbi:histone acetyltransferase type B catalytic subunit-like [Teratosphaeria destructans]|uniref:Histone acetyltransferase type B catalytic subunit n=1 Tax=Teratosphaeria destructans TaxID=418781 RepID=A0A9W7SSB8_9PEZI|nr:histone acetyltransferase type B catalytic subunit-like [Teratosphaeria destructans]